MNIENERKEFLRKELREYEKATQMTEDERKAVREWVKSGHSVHENSSMACHDGGYPLDFLDVYRDEEYIRKATIGMTPKETKQFADAYYGWDCEEPHEPEGTSLEEQLIALGY